MESVELQENSVKDKKYYGVNLQNGDLTLSPPPDLVTGVGDFPYSLSFQRYYDSSNTVVDGVTPSIFVQLPALLAYERANLGGGWKHSFSISAKQGSDGLAGMGRDSAVNASAMIAGLYTLRTLNTGSTGLRERLATVLVTHWAVNQLNANVVNVRRPPNDIVFTRLPDGSYNAPPGSADKLVQTGERTPYNNLTWDYRNIDFTLTDKAGSVMNLDFNRLSSTPAHAEREPSTWTFPSGVVVSFAYGSSSSSTYDLTVSNNLGRKLFFDTKTSDNTSQETTDKVFFKVTDETGLPNRVVKISAQPLYGAICQAPLGCLPNTYSVQAPDGGVTTYEYLLYPGTDMANPSYIRQRNFVRIGKHFTPTDHVNPFLTFNYNDFFQIEDILDNQEAGPYTTDYFVAGLYGMERTRRAEVQDPLGASTVSYFNDHGLLTQQTDALNQRTRYAYDLHRRMTIKEMPELNRETYGYDVRHNRTVMTQIAKPSSGLADMVTTTTYEEDDDVTDCVSPASCNKPDTVTDPAGNVTDYDWNATTGLLERMTRPTVTAYKYNAGSMTTVSEAPVTTYCYGNYGSPTFKQLVGVVEQVDDTTQRVRKFVYGTTTSSKYVLSASQVNPLLGYNDQCGASYDFSALNLNTFYTFDAVGNVESIDGPRTDITDTTTYDFDAMRRIIEVEGPEDDMLTQYEYDLDGLLVETRRQDNSTGSLVMRIETREYYDEGTLKKVTDPDGKFTQYTYDPLGRVDTVTDPDNRQTKTVYDLIGQTTCTWKGGQPLNPGAPCDWNPASYASNGNDGPLRYAAYEYSANGKQTSVTDANNNETLFTLDGHDRALRTTFPDATYEEFTYYDSGQLCSGDSQPCEKRLRNGGTLAYTYDALNRMVSKDPSDAQPVNFGYNLVGDPNYIYEAAGLLNSPSAHYSYRNYDKAGRQTVETSELGDIGYQYDQAGNRSRTTWPDGYYVTYGYDAANRMLTVAEYGSLTLADYVYDSLSRRELLTLGGVTTKHKVVYQYEANDRLKQLDHYFGYIAPAISYGYGYNDSGQLTSLGANDTFYLGAPRASETYTVNNLNQYATVGGNTLNYDPNGNLTRWDSPEYGVQRYSYDIENRLQTVAVNGSLLPTHYYDYDGLGRRVYKRTDAILGIGDIFIGGNQTFYLLDGDEEIAEYDQSGTLLRRYVTGPAIDDRIAMIEGNSLSPSVRDRLFYHTDHQGSVVTINENSGARIDRYAYDEYGLLTNAASTEGQPFRYTGRRYDEETGLYYYRARYYSPELGRFLSTDPIGYWDDLNLYAYVKNDPLNGVDPSGSLEETLVVGQLLTGATYVAIQTGPVGWGLLGAALVGYVGYQGYQVFCLRNQIVMLALSR